MHIFINRPIRPACRYLSRDQSAFTIIELLVVIVVIGILAAITIVSYTGITSRAAKATLQSDLKNASTQLGIDNVTNGSYPASEAAANGGKGLSKSSGTTYQYSATTNGYCISANSTTAGSSTYRITSTGGTVEAGVCPLVWRQISAGFNHTCAISSVYQVYCWGWNANGQVGNNSDTDSPLPVAVDTSGVLSGKTIKSITTGNDHTCVVASDNLVYCWGYNYAGALGNNSTTHSHIPVAVDTTGVLSGKTVKSITAGSYFTCAIASDDLAYCWGQNIAGQLGDNSTTRSLVPVAVNRTNLVSALYDKTVKSIAAGGQGHTCVIASDDLAYCWGSNYYGALGDNSDTDSPVPVAVDKTGVLSGKTVLSIVKGGEHTCAIASDNLAYCWGRSVYGALGNNSDAPSLVPIDVDRSGVLSGKTILAIATSPAGSHTCAIASDNFAYCWGYNADYGQLGNNSITDSWVPVAVDASGVLSGKAISNITIGGNHTCAIDSNNQAYCWGWNGYGELGNNSVTYPYKKLVPVAVVLP